MSCISCELPLCETIMVRLSYKYKVDILCCECFALLSGKALCYVPPKHNTSIRDCLDCKNTTCRGHCGARGLARLGMMGIPKEYVLQKYNSATEFSLFIESFFPFIEFIQLLLRSRPI